MCYIKFGDFMDIIGVICEYNPFHNGHIYHIKKIKELYSDSLIIAVISGYFCQRGEVSILSKEDKTKIALNNGIDIVLELPAIYSTQSADIFASKAIEILNKFKVNKIVFGSECNDISVLENIVNKQLNDDEYNSNVKKYLDEGLNYPTALSKSLNINFDINNPNDLLGISYIKAIKEKKYNITPCTIKRTNDFHDLEKDDEIISASNIRNKLDNNIDIINYVPNGVLECINKVNYDKFFELIKYKTLTDHYLEQYLTVDEGIESRIKNVILESNSLNDLIKNIKTKRYTYNKISRMLFHILLGLLKKDKNIDITYIRVLGFNTTGQDYLNSIKKDINTSLDHKSKIYKYELKASLIYDLLTNKNTYEFEIQNKPIIK